MLNAQHFSNSSKFLHPKLLNINVLQHSYGFIQCCEREARLFFHFSEYSGDINTVKIGGEF